MEVKNITEVRNNIAAITDSVIDSQSVVVITRGNKPPVVMMSLEEYNGWKETDYLLRNPINRKILMDRVARDKNNEYEVHDLLEE